MLQAEELRGNWTMIRGKLKEKWGQLTDDDLRVAEGNFDQVVGRIQQRTGAATSQIEDFIDSLTSSHSTVGRMAGAVKDEAQHVAERVREGYDAVKDRAREGYDQVRDEVSTRYRDAENVVRRHPAESMLGMFAAGMLTGLVVGVVLFRSHD